MGATSKNAVEYEGRVGLGEQVMRADLSISSPVEPICRGKLTWMGRSPSFLTSTSQRFRPALSVIFSFLQMTAPASGSIVGSGKENLSMLGMGRNEPYSAISTILSACSFHSFGSKISA